MSNQEQSRTWNETLLKSQGIYIEACGFGFIIADYNNHRARYRGQGKEWKQQPLIPDPFLTKVEAIEAAGKYVSVRTA